MATDIKQIFEYELIRKLSIRVKQNTSGMMFLVNSFKFFDLSNSGRANSNQWLRTFGKIGLNGFSDEDLLSLFNQYDVNNQGTIDYKAFAFGIYGEGPRIEEWTHQNNHFNNNQQIQNQFQQPNKSPTPQRIQPQQQGMQPQAMNPSLSPQETTMNDRKQMFQNLLFIFQDHINKYNGLPFYTLFSKVKEKEDPYTHKIPFSEIAKIMPAIKINIPLKEQNDFYSLLDIHGDGLAMSDDFLGLIRGDMNEKRRLAVINAFTVWDTNKLGSLDINKIKQLYNPRNHPEITTGRITNPQEIYDAFVYVFDIYCNCKGLTKQGYIVLDNFVEFYSGISASIENDDLFIDIIRNVWLSPANNAGAHINKTPTPQHQNQGQPQQNQSQVDSNLTSLSLNKLKNIIYLRGNEGIFSLIRAARTFSNSLKDYNITVKDFELLNKSLCLNLSPAETQSLCWDTVNNSINFLNLFSAIYGEMNDLRKNIVYRAFKSLDIKNKDVVDLSEMRKRYDAMNHPDVLSRKHSVEQVYAMFLDNLQSYWYYIGKGSESTINIEEFFDFYNIISMSIPEDQQFEMLIRNLWNLK